MLCHDPWSSYVLPLLQLVDLLHPPPPHLLLPLASCTV
jgi:hypothetical protein